MSNVLIIKTDQNKLLSHFEVNQDYSGLATKVASLMTQFHPGRAVIGYALANAETMNSAIVAGKEWCPGVDCTIEGDFDVLQKQNVAGKTIVPPSGMTAGDLSSTDNCLCHTP